MKPLFLILALLFATQSIAVAPYGFKGQDQTATQYSNVLKFKNRSVVKTGGINSLVEDQDNLLYNGGFEATPDLDGWTCVGDGSSLTIQSKPVSASVVISGDKTLAISCATVGGCTCTQDFSVNQQQIGRSVLLSGIVRTSSDVQGLKLTYRENGADTSVTTENVLNGIPATEAVIGSSATTIGIKLTIPYSATPLVVRVDEIKMAYGTAVTNQPAIGPEISYTPTFTNVNTPTNINFTYQQIGSNLRIKGYYTGAGGTATNELRIGLPSGMTTSNRINPIQSLGTLNSSYSGAFDSALFILATPNKSYLNVGLYSGGASGLSPASLSSAGFSSGRNYSFEVLVPINELASSVPTYTGRCNDKKNCSTTLAFSRNTSNVISNISPASSTFNPTCTGTSTITCDLTSGNFTVTPYCWAFRGDLQGLIFRPSSTSTTSVTIPLTNSSSEASNVLARVYCERQGSDFENAFILQQNVALKSYVQTPNTTGKVGFCSAKISATGVISDQLGGCFASCTNATTPVCTFTSNYWKSGSVPNCWISISPAAGYAPSDVQVTTTTMQGLMVNTSWGTQSGARTYICHGEIQ